MALREPGAFAGQSVQNRRIHVRMPAGADRVVSLLVRDDEQDVGLLRRHAGKGFVPLTAFLLMRVYLVGTRFHIG